MQIDGFVLTTSSPIMRTVMIPFPLCTPPKTQSTDHGGEGALMPDRPSKKPVAAADMGPGAEHGSASILRPSRCTRLKSVLTDSSLCETENALRGRRAQSA